LDEEEEIKRQKSTTLQVTYRREDDFLYGVITGNQLEEFPLIKYDKNLKPKSIYFCIDGFNITYREN